MEKKKTFQCLGTGNRQEAGLWCGLFDVNCIRDCISAWCSSPLLHFLCILWLSCHQCFGWSLSAMYVAYCSSGNTGTNTVMLLPFSPMLIFDPILPGKLKEKNPKHRISALYLFIYSGIVFISRNIRCKDNTCFICVLCLCFPWGSTLPLLAP